MITPENFRDIKEQCVNNPRFFGLPPEHKFQFTQINNIPIYFNKKDLILPFKDFCYSVTKNSIEAHKYG